MDIKEAREALNAGVTPSPDYPDLPNDLTAEALIAFDPKAELEYRMAKDRSPRLTRALVLQSWRSFRIGSIWGFRKNSKKTPLLQRAAELWKRRG